MTLNMVDEHNGIAVETKGTDGSFSTVVRRISDGYVSLYRPTKTMDEAQAKHAETLDQLVAGTIGVFDTPVNNDEGD